MEWFKGRSSFIIGSDRWLGGQGTPAAEASASLPSPAAPKGLDQVQKPQDEQQQQPLSSSFYPTITEYNPLSGLRVRSPTRESSTAASPPSKLYPDIYQLPPEAEVGKDVDGAPATEDPVPVQGRQEVLVTVADAMVHLVDQQESVLMASGDFTLEKLLQNGEAVAIFARVGNELQWPLVKDMPVTKLDASHYVFSLRVDPEEDDKSAATDTLNYGVTFKADGNKELLEVLDKALEQYSYFSAPTMLQASEEEIKKMDADKIQESSSSREVLATSSELSIPGKPISSDIVGADQKPSDAVSTAYWTTLAPNVDDYNSSLARAIASGTGHIIRGIFWCSDTTVSNLEKGGRFVKRHSNVCNEPSTVHPRTMKNIRRAKRVTKMSEKVAKGVLTGVVSVTGYFTTTIVNSRAGKKFFKLLPGEVALASLEGFGRIFDAIEVAGTNVLATSSVVTTGAISHRYGDKAGELAQEGFATAGHLFGVAWTISKLRNAFNPKNAIKPTAVLRTAAKAAASEAKNK